MAFIRPFKPSDTDACKHICIATLPPTLLAAPESTQALAPYLWTLPFTTLSPDTCLVLDDGTGLAVGYCIGTPSVFSLCAPSSYAHYTTTVLAPNLPNPNPPPSPTPSSPGPLPPFLSPEDSTVNPHHLLQKAFSPHHLILSDALSPPLNGEYKGMMHVDILPAFQSQGFGRGLVEGFLALVKAKGPEVYGKGCYLGVSGENVKVVGFYERLGWRVVEDRGEGSEGGVTMVFDL